MDKKIEDRFKKLTPIQHILKRPGMYIGNVYSEKMSMFVFENVEFDKLIYKEINYNAGFFKIYDEILTNASDHAIRCKENKWGPVTYIKILVEKDHITIENNGPGIPIKKHKEHKVYVPELVFGNVHSGENFNDDEKRIVGGLHGLGASLTNIFSKKFIIETADGKKKYRQSFTNNLSRKNKATITKSTRNYTKVTYYPDFEKFGLTEITDEIQSLFLKRVIDIATYNPKVKVYYNKKLISIRSFKDYIKMFVDDQDIIFEDINDNWQIGIAKTQIDTFQQVSMINGVTTINGGTHVNFVTNQILKTLKEKLDKSYKGFNIKPNIIKNHLFIFVNCKITNPDFENQTKERLITRLTANHIKDFKISDSFYKKVLSSDLKNEIVNFIALKEFQTAKKETEQNSRKTKLKIKKLDDAKKAGTNESLKSFLLITEGESAKSTAKAGISVVNNDYWGVYSLKGKPLSVKNISLNKLRNNTEISDIISALGLEIGKKYTSTRTLRYGKVVFLSDADIDGTHIKGLLINLFETYWPELLELDFIYEFITPIMKLKKNKFIKYFYSLNEYENWKKRNNEKGCFLKYIKGLGTIEPNEIKLFFKDIDKHLVKFNSENIKEEREKIDMIFNQQRTNDRKDWILSYDSKINFNKFDVEQTYKSFFDNEFIEYSIADNVRSIPSIVDGLKPSQRKILYTLLIKNHKNEIKVNQLVGSIMENAAYHHGNLSLEQTIISMSQNFVGSNNINLLNPVGQFGTRLKGGKDASASRYIFTNLNKITRILFNKSDDNILEYLEDDGLKIEPRYYVPIIPMVLVNGSEGIGSGWSSFIPKFNPADLITYIENKLKGRKRNIKLDPWYKDYKGEIIYDGEHNRYISKSIVIKTRNKKIKDNLYHITELPIGMWNEKYRELLDKLIKDGDVIDYDDDSTDLNIDIKIRTPKNILRKDFNIETYLSMNNMMLFDKNGKIKKYENQYQIVDDFFDIRLEYYKLRKENILKVLEEQKLYLVNKMKFIRCILKKEIIIENKTKKNIESQMLKMKILKWNDSYDYLLNISLIQLSKEKLTEIQNVLNKKKEEVEKLKSTTIENMWKSDLLELKKMCKINEKRV